MIVGEPGRLVGLQGRHYVYGGGASPVGAQMNLRTHSSVQPYLASTGGFVYFRERVFSKTNTQFQFTVEIEGGIQVFATPRSTVVIGYRYHHFSNAHIYLDNPALETHMAVFGLSFLR